MAAANQEPGEKQRVKRLPRCNVSVALRFAARDSPPDAPADRRRRCADSLNKAPVYKAKTPEAASIAAFASEISVFRPFQANSRIEPACAFGVGQGV